MSSLDIIESVVIFFILVFLFIKSRLLSKELKELKDNKIESKQATPQIDKSKVDENYIFDVKRTYWRDGDGDASSAPSGGIQPSQKMSVKPIKIVDELKESPRKLSLVGLDEKIDILKDKSEFIRQRYAKNELNGLIQCLEHRKNYDSYFNQFSTTSEEKINELLLKYELVIESADIFIPEFPEEALNIMKSYNSRVMQVTGGKKAVFYVIAEKENFDKLYDKRDPILLAQSPFGFYYDILGAWDKEMLLLSEL